jgi:hypothetical protein
LWSFGVGDAFKEMIGRSQNRECSSCRVEMRGQTSAMTLAGLAEENSFDAAARTKSFFDKTRAFNANGTAIGGQSAAKSHAEVLEPPVVAAGDEVFRVA